MILIKSKDDAATVAAIERALKGQEIDIFQADDEEYTTEELMKMIAYNAKQTRVYVGRLERNSRGIDTNMKQLVRLLEPLATYASYMIAQSGEDEESLNELRKNRERRLAMEAARNPSVIGKQAERMTNEGE